MLNFTVGPVMTFDSVREIGSQQVPYFRTSEFSDIMLNNEKLILEFANAPQGSKAVFMTCSSTGSMEAVVMNCFSENDNLLIINGGSFGQRFVDICNVHSIPYVELSLSSGEQLTKERLYEYDNGNFTGLLVNIDETSTGVLYDSQMIGDFCKKNNLFYVCDCVSSFLADAFNMSECGADVMITGSQKALACPPGISIIVLSPEGVSRVQNTKVKSLYFNINDALINQQRGQTPYTPAVSILLQINKRLNEIKSNGGVDAEINRVANLAIDFRNKLIGLPFELFSACPANGVTSVHPLTASAHQIFLTLKDEYNIWICPNGGALKDSVFRVGHIGALTPENNTELIDALKDMQKRGLI